MVSTQVRALTYAQAVNEAFHQEFERDPSVILMGEDVAGGAGRDEYEDAWGGVFKLTGGLIGKFGPDRVRDTPISENGFMGAAVGAAATGLRPIADLMFVGFVGVCGDQIFNNMSKMHYMFGGKVNLPLTVITSTGAGVGSAAQHSETLNSIFVHFPGLKCVAPSNPYNAKGLHAAAIRDNDPVIVFNNKLLMGGARGPGTGAGIHGPEDSYEFPIGKADRAREGTDVTLIGISYTTLQCLKAAEILEQKGFSAEVIDLLSLSPLDEDAILSSVKKTRNVVIVDEDYPMCSMASELSALIAEQAFDFLDSPPIRLCAPHASVPYSPVLEAEYIPSPEKIAQSALSILE